MRLAAIFLSSLFLLSSLSLSAQAAWYVSTTLGSNSNGGLSPSAPLQTVQYAINSGFIAPGDTIYFVGQNSNVSYNPAYSFSGNINDPHIWTQENSVSINNLNGTANNYIYIRPYDNTTVLKGDGANIFRIQNSSFLKIEGFELYGEVENIPLATAEALQFLYREVDSTTTYYRVPPGTPDSIVDTMTFAPLANITRPSYTDTRGMYLSNVHHIDIIGNKIHHTPGGGLRVAECDYINILQNEIHDCSRKSYSGTHALVVTKATSQDTSEAYKINISRNRVHHNYNEIYSWAPTKTFITARIDEGKGISLQRNSGLLGWTHGRFLISNNLCYWNGFSGIHSNEGESMDFVNNTCYMNSYTNSVTYASNPAGNNIGASAAGGDDIRFFNNAIVIDAGWGGFPISVAATTNVEVADNIVFGLNGTLNHDPDVTSIELNTTVADPNFVAANIFDFRLQVGSPAIGLANTAYAPADDFNGDLRDANPDLGAIEFFSGLALSAAKDISLKAFPNPFSAHIILQGYEIQPETIIVRNILGQQMPISLSLISENTYKIECTELPSGIYILQANGQSIVLRK